MHQLDSREQLGGKIRKYYAFNQLLSHAIEQMPLNDDNSFERACKVCFNGYCKSGNSYFLSVYDDLHYDEYTFLPKAAANRILLRNCIESNLLLNVFINKPHLAEKYFQTLPSDQERIRNLYITDKKEESNEGIETKRFMKRFAWLPKIKGKKANTMNDLLNYVDFDSDAQKDYYRIIIRNFDTYIHPSFHFAKSIAENFEDGNIANISALFMDEGLVYESAYNVLSAMEDIYGDRINPNVFLALQSLLEYDDESSYDVTPISINTMMSDQTPYSKEVLIKSALTSFSIEAQYENNMEIHPNYTQGIAYTIGICSYYIQRLPIMNYKSKNISYLLQDLTPRYDDLIGAFFEHNDMLFYAQARYIVEAFSIINILLREDNNRSFIYGVHQKIKGYEARATAVEFIRKNTTKIKTDVSNDELEAEYQRDIQIVRKYYLDLFQKELDDNTILRLNGWALYLKGKDNEQVPNSPYFVHMLAEILPYTNSEEITSYLLGFYEESNAFTHVTPYAFDYRAEEQNLTPAMLLINELLRQLMSQLIRAFDFEQNLNEQEKEQVQTLLFDAIESMTQDFAPTLNPSPVFPFGSNENINNSNQAS